jgi:ubiquinone/menaquinone biosynthesis C-methylase UbiE
MNTQHASYVVEMSEAELQRLVSAANAWGNLVRAAAFVAGVRPGYRVIDIGCGPLGALRELAEMVGPEGAVVGVDVSRESLGRARFVLDQQGLGWVQLRQVEVNSDSLLAEVTPPGPFDFAFCRLFLVHQADPATTLRQIARVVRPGGMIVAQEPAFGPPEGSDVLPAVQRASDWIYEVVGARGGHPTVGRQMYELAAAANLELVWQALFATFRPGGGSLTFAAESLRSVKRAILDLRLHSEAEIDETIGEIEDAVHSERWQTPQSGQVAISAQFRVPG